MPDDEDIWRGAAKCQLCMFVVQVIAPVEDELDSAIIGALESHRARLHPDAELNMQEVNVGDANPMDVIMSLNDPEKPGRVN